MPIPAPIRLAAGLLLACSTLAAPPPTLAQRPPGGPPPAVPVMVVDVTTRAVVEDVGFVATVEPSVSTTVSVEVAGQVKELLVQEGQHVTAGSTVMARLDTTSREIQLRETEAARTKAREQLAMLRRGTRAEEVALREAAMAEQQALLARAEAEFQRARQLFQDHLISRSELERLQADYLAVRQKHEAALQAFQMAREGPRPEEITQAEADLAQATARVERIQHETRQATIRAPISGHVVKKHVEAGAWVQPGTAVVSLIALDPVFVTGPVGERDIARVRTGQPAQVTADAYPGQVFSGTVTAIVPGADTGSRAFPVRVTLRNPDTRLKAGMFARVSVRTGQGRQGLFVPKDAVVRRGGQEYVFVVDGDTARQVKIEIGALVDGLVEVRARELAPGLKAITLGNEFLQPGMKIRPTP